jgi:hypothetical protein
MWPVFVVVPDVLGERPFQVRSPRTRVQSRHSPPCGPNKALRIGVGTRRSHRGLDDLDSLRGEHRVEA